MIRIKTRNKTLSSIHWIKRRHADSYINMSKKHGYISRAAYKLQDIEKKFMFLKSAQSCIIDLGSSPGSWLQVISEVVQSEVMIVGIDLLKLKHKIKRVHFLQGDIRDSLTLEKLERTISSKFDLSSRVVDCVLSDMAPNTSGDKEADNIRIVHLAECALQIALRYLKHGGIFAVKLFLGKSQVVFTSALKEYFQNVHYFKPKSSYSSSSEIFIIATNFNSNSI